MIVCRSAAEIERLATVNALVARVLAELKATVHPGISTAALDALAERLLSEAGTSNGEAVAALLLRESEGPGGG